MKNMGVNEIREKFLAFFETKEHLRLQSHSLIPDNDKSLLLINSGMAPLKPFFTGERTPPSKRVTTCQKCIRTGDLENVGRTARHGTFFEMLGDFSFGDYFKEEIIPWSWEFCVDVMEIPEDRLYVTIYEDDDEAFDIWVKNGIPAEKITRMGKDDNFWEVGLGPCGPCSEIYYDRGEKYGCGKPDCKVGCDCDRYMEFWNLVFTQFDKQPDGSYPRLAAPNIDTGMGLERMAVLMQDVPSIFDVDTIKALRDKICEIAGVSYMTDLKTDVSIRVITDHARAMTFLTADGVLPSNEGRGYVLRRLLRRAARHGKTLGIERTFLSDVCEKVIETSSSAYPELLEKRDYILKVVSFEEKRFYDTLDQGLEILKSHIAKLKSEGKKIMDGATEFRLYDTFGFPPDLTMEILDENGIGFDKKAFEEELERQREKARGAREESDFAGHAHTVYEKLDPALVTEFAGYGIFEVCDTKVVALAKDGELVQTVVDGDEIAIFVEKTPFYAESGGQTGDGGTITSGSCEIEISDCVKTYAGKIVHTGVVKGGSVSVGDLVSLKIDLKRRAASARNHTATHLLHQALRDVLGTHVEQAGSYVSPERLRFDFTHFSPLTEEEREQVEQIVVDKIFDVLPIETSVVSMDEARKMGATALFGEKYGDTVRVVKIGDYSTELCGGTHMPLTGGIGEFRILTETGVASGVRRIEAITGYEVVRYYKDLEKLLGKVAKTLKTNPQNIIARVSSMLDDMKELSKNVDSLRARMSGNVVDKIINSKEEIKGVSVIRGKLSDMDAGSLREMGDRIKDKLGGEGVVILASHKEGAVSLLAMASDAAVKKGVHAGKIISEIAPLIEGKGGGKPNMAQAGGKYVNGIEAAIEKALAVIESQL